MALSSLLEAISSLWHMASDAVESSARPMRVFPHGESLKRRSQREQEIPAQISRHRCSHLPPGRRQHPPANQLHSQPLAIRRYETVERKKKAQPPTGRTLQF
jgi:hypothetical protein